MTLSPVPALHPNFSYRVDFIGRERQPVLVIDNFLNNAEGLVAYCEQLATFASADGMYPGIRFPAPGLYVEAMYQHLGPLITSVFGLPDPDQMRVQSDFSLVVTPPAELQPRQRIPHYDSAKPHDLASVHYLCSGEKGGTSLYRHIATDFERIDLARVIEYKAIIAEQEKLTGFPNQYMNGSNELFEQIATYDAVFNRMLIYRCTSLHSGNIAPDLPLDPNPRTGRLTLNTFILSQG